MTTVVTTTTRFWESDDSLESIIDHYRGEYAIWSSRNLKPAKQQTSQVKKINKQTSKSISRTSVLAVPKRNLKTELSNDASKVKKSALLYEITDRTNRLARPRTTAISNDNSTGGKYLSSRVSLPTNSHVSSRNVSERFSELSRPKTIYNPPIRTLGYIAPSALRAVATKRIVELATPRKKPSEASSKKKNNRYGFVETPCSSRINYLARPKKFVKRKEAQKNYLKRSIPSQILRPPPWEFPRTRVWRRLGYSKNVSKKSERMGKQKTKRSRIVETSKSDQSVITLPVRRRNTKKSRGKIKRNYFV